MTVIINTIWGGRISQIVDRQISRVHPMGGHTVVDKESNKVIIILARDALASIAYTGVAVANQTWMDCQIANCIAHRKLELAYLQCGTRYLARPIHAVLSELAINLNGCLNSDSRARLENLTVSIVGWHLGARFKPFAWELRRGPIEHNGMRYFRLLMHSHRVGKFFRENPCGLWGETYGDPGDLVDGRLKDLATMRGMTHDDVEFYFRDAIRSRARQTATVSSDCIAVQLDPRVSEWQARVTYYPSVDRANGHPLLSPWVMTSQLICAPSYRTSNFLPTSDCGRYALGGFEDGNTRLKVELRLPSDDVQNGRRVGGGSLPRPSAK
jgi:hypothetical protein